MKGGLTLNIGIVGAGVIGLTAALNMAKNGHNVTILEAEDYYGGLASSIKVANTSLEKFYHHIFTSDQDFINLIEELGLPDKLLWIEPKNAIYINKKTYPFSTPKDLLLFGGLSFINRIKMGLAVLKARKLDDYKALESMSAKDWIIQTAGEQCYEKVWGPLLHSKFDVDAPNVSAVWIWNKFKLRGSTRSKDGKKEVLGYMNGGFERVYRTLIEKLISLNVKIVYNSPITGIANLENDKCQVSTDSEKFTFDKLLLTFAPEILKGMKTPFSEFYIDKITRVKYKANICMILRLKKPLTPYYWITIADKEIPFVVLVEHTNFISPKDYGCHIVYLSRYLDEKDNLFSQSNEEIEKTFIEGLKKLYPKFNEKDIIEKVVSKARYSQPVVVQNYSELKFPTQTLFPNIYIANMTSIYPEDRGQNYCAKLGKEVSNQMMEG